MALASVVTLGGQLGWTVLSLPKGPTSVSVTNYADLANQDSMMAYLNGIDPVSYTPSRLLNMTANDMVYAMRVIQDRTNI